MVVYNKNENINFFFVKEGAMELFDLLKECYGENEPILLSEVQVDGMTDANLRQQIKKLTDEGKLKRYSTGVYYIPVEDCFGFDSIIPMDIVIERKYLRNRSGIFGYLSGLTFANEIGVTSQVPAVYDVVTNRATSDYRETSLVRTKVILRKPKVTVTEENYRILQFLDLLRDIDEIAEEEGERLKKTILLYMESMKISFADMEPFLPCYPDRIYRNMYETGVLRGVSP